MAQMTGFKVYKGTKETFILSGKAAANTDAIVFITGGDDKSKSCIYAQNTYFANFAEFISALNYVKGVNIGGQSYNAAEGGGYVAFASKDPATVAVSVENGAVEIGLKDTFIEKVDNTATELGSKDDAANKEGSAFARIANLAALVSDLTGGSTDSIEGQITAAINALRTEITGDLTTDATDAKTLEAINDELNELGTNLLETYTFANTNVSSLAGRITNEAPVTIAESAGTGDVLKTYTFTQNGKEIGKINLAKDVVVTSGAVVLHDGVKCLELTLTSGDVVHIPVTDLVDVYTAKANADKVQVVISDSNEISASIVAGAVTVSELADNAVETAKISDKNVTKAKLADDVQASLDKADTAYQKPADGIAKTDLASDVQTSLGKADTALQSYTEQYKGTVTGVKVNGTTKSPSSGVVDLGTVITAHQDISGKQDKLVSGTNIKTINGTSILGSGDIVISGGGGSSSGSGAYAEINHGTSDTTFALTPNTFHVWDEVASLTLTLGSETSGVANEYLFQFTSGATATSLSLPSDLKWAEELVIEPNMIYQVSILKGLASVLEFANAPALIENKVTVSISGTKYLVSLQYAAASDIVVKVRTADGPISVNILSGEISKTASPAGPMIDSSAYIESITPVIDNNYNYTW